MKGNRLGESVVSFFKRRRERKLLKNSFGRYVSAEELTAILNGKECVGTSESSEETIFFLIAHVRDQTLEEVPNLVREATEVIVDHGGLVTSRFSSCIMAVFRPKWELANHVKCVEAARQLVDRLGVSVRVVYGSAVGFFTTLGSGVSMSMECLAIIMLTKMEKTQLGLD